MKELKKPTTVMTDEEKEILKDYVEIFMMCEKENINTYKELVNYVSKKMCYYAELNKVTLTSEINYENIKEEHKWRNILRWLLTEQTIFLIYFNN